MPIQKVYIHELRKHVDAHIIPSFTTENIFKWLDSQEKITKKTYKEFAYEFDKGKRTTNIMINAYLREKNKTDEEREEEEISRINRMINGS